MDKKIPKVDARKKVIVLEFPSLREMEAGLNKYLSKGWILIDMRSDYLDGFWQSHVCWLGRKSFVARMEKIFEKPKEKPSGRFEKLVKKIKGGE